MTLPVHALTFGVVVVAASTAALQAVTGYGTVLFQIIVLSAWSIVGAVKSEGYADLHHGPVWLVALLLNVCIFSVPALVFYLITRRRWPTLSFVGLLAWTAIYLGCLFLFFPATDGP